MGEIVIYHNPRCSKSRQTLELLRSRDIEPRVVEYLKDPLDARALEGLSKKLGLPPKGFIRVKEEAFKELAVDLDDDQAVIAAIVSHPALLERPIVVHGDKAAIGRPPEAVLDIL